MFNFDLEIIKTKINKNSENYKYNYKENTILIEKLQEEFSKALYEGETKILAKYKKDNRLTPRERIEYLLDPDSPFLELLPIAGWGMDCYKQGSSIVGGIGVVSNKICVIISHLGTIKGGAIDGVTLQKMQRINDIAKENKLIFINLMESSGANLTKQDEIFNYAGTIFKDITNRSKNGLPTISAVFGSCAAGGAYVPSVSDYVIMTKDSSKMFVSGSVLVKLATGETTDDYSLGGADLHSRISGASDYLVDNEYQAIKKIRELVYYFKDYDEIYKQDDTVEEPLYNSNEILGVISNNVKIPFDIKELIARIVDGSKFSEFKKDYGITIVTGFAKINGFKVGIIGNNGVLFSDTSNKAAQFVQLCNNNNVPIIFLQNITGFIVGKKYEEEGILKHGGKMLNTIANSEVPLITILVGASYGAGNFAMCGRSIKPSFLFSYPNSKNCVMGSEQISGVLKMISKNEHDFDEMNKNLENQAMPYFTSGRMWDDGIINPKETRTYLSMCLEIFSKQYTKPNPNYGVFRF
ncbi:MAG: carboxyl transferase domain-containing protein [Candidatus Sericytochromatia bacterium]